MPYIVPEGATLQLTLEGSMEQQQVMTVLHYRAIIETAIGDGYAALMLILNEVTASDQLKDQWLDCLSTAVTNVKTRAQWITPTRYGAREKIVAPSSGQVAGAAMPVNAAAAITRRSEGSGRGQLATIHLPGLVKDAVVDGLITAAQQAKMTVFADATINTITPAGGTFTLQPIIFNRAAPNLSPFPVNYTVQRTVRTMHRRTVGLGS